jgi:small ligand-binding sensory domain FIST
VGRQPLATASRLIRQVVNGALIANFDILVCHAYHHGVMSTSASSPSGSAFPNRSGNGDPLKAPFAASAISGHLDTRTAATEVADVLFDEIGCAGDAKQSCDLLLFFGSFHHRSAFDEAAAILRKTISPRAMIGVTAEAVLGNDKELEGVAGLSAIGLRLPHLQIHPWYSSPEEPVTLQDRAQVRQRIGFVDERNPPRAVIMFGDPFTTPITRLLPAITNCGKPITNSDAHSSDANTPDNRHLRPAACPVPVIGGMASGASQPGMNVLVLNDRVTSAGAIGMSLFGEIDIDFIVSQGCRPIGTPLVITKCNQNTILELGGRKAIDALQQLAQELPEPEKRLLGRGLLMGRVINEYKDHFGRGDFLVRNVMGLDQRVGGIVAGESCRVGQTIQFHVRDAATAAEDLQLLLDAQVLNPVQPLAALLFSCNGRGERLFNQPNHDIAIVRDRLGEVPIAGFFAAGEFGPIGDRSFLHGHTASLAVMRVRPS